MTSFAPPWERRAVGFLIATVALAAATALALTASATWDAFTAHRAAFVSLFLLTLALGLVAVEIYGRGSISVAGVGVLTVGLTLGVGPAMVSGVALAAVHLVRMRSLSRSLFNAGTLALAAGSAVVAYDALVDSGFTVLDRLFPAIVAGGVYWAVNIGLLTLAMSLSEGTSAWTIWRERFRWLTFHYVAFGPLALASTVAYEEVGVPGLVAFVVPPALLMVSVRQYIARTQEYVEKLSAANEELSDHNEHIRKVHLDTIAALSRSMEAKDDYTGNHTERVSSIAVALARRLGFADAELEAIETGALLHDIGKIGIPERILNKPGPLDIEEWIVMRRHPVISEYILSGVEVSPIVRDIARSSHERMDGTGYPDGLAGEEIPLAARVVLVADAFDALTSDRPYRPARDVDSALEEIRRNVGTQFCPRVVAALNTVALEERHVLGEPDPSALQVA